MPPRPAPPITATLVACAAILLAPVARAQSAPAPLAACAAAPAVTAPRPVLRVGARVRFVASLLRGREVCSYRTTRAGCFAHCATVPVAVIPGGVRVTLEGSDAMCSGPGGQVRCAFREGQRVVVEGVVARVAGHWSVPNATVCLL